MALTAEIAVSFPDADTLAIPSVDPALLGKFRGVALTDFSQRAEFFRPNRRSARISLWGEGTVRAPIDPPRDPGEHPLASEPN